jgi:ATP/maltotriose-dependent transcriptional regulator MalT
MTEAGGLLERERELGALDELLGGEGADLVVIEGAAGIGKSRLLAELTYRAAGDPVLIGELATTPAAVHLEPGPLGDIAQTLYVTPKTVELHLSHAYRKLGIRSQRELGRALAA